MSTWWSTTRAWRHASRLPSQRCGKESASRRRGHLFDTPVGYRLDQSLGEHRPSTKLEPGIASFRADRTISARHHRAAVLSERALPVDAVPARPHVFPGPSRRGEHWGVLKFHPGRPPVSPRTMHPTFRTVVSPTVLTNH